MAPRRHSRTPLMLTQDEQKIMVAAADDDPRIREFVERAFGVSWTGLPMQKKLQLVHDLDERGRVLGALAGAVRGHRDFEHEVTLYRDELAAEDKVRLLEEQVQTLKDEKAVLENRVRGPRGAGKSAAR